MPKKFDEAKKQEWLKLYEEGKSESWIAHRSGCDTRTVKKAINELRLKRDVVLARVELVRDALRKHQDSLLEEVNRIMSDLVIPEKDLAMLSWQREEDFAPGGSTYETKTETGEDTALRRLLKQHLRQDKLWRMLTRWRKARDDHMTARARLQCSTIALLEKKTGYKVVYGNGAPPFVCSYTAGPLLYKAALDIAFAPPKEREAIMKSIGSGISTDTANGRVSFQDRLILAVAPGRERKTRDRLLDALQELAKSEEVKAVVETNGALEQTRTRAKEVVEDIKLLGLIPGQCDICRRLGM